jgi:hypothetical protein
MPALIQFIQDQYELEVIMLRMLQLTGDFGTTGIEVVLLMENLSPDNDLSADACWSDAAGLVHISSSFVHKAVESWFEEPSDIPPQRASWAIKGWFAETRRWVEDQVVAAGMEVNGPLRQRRVWSITAMLIQPTKQGDLFLKATNPMFGPEPEITRLLGEHFPANIPQTVAIEPSRHLTMTRDFQGTLLVEDLDPKHWEIMIETYANIQRRIESRSEELLTMGCWDRRILVIAAQIDELIADTEPMQIGSDRYGFTREDYDELVSLAPRLRISCDELAQIGIPPTLVHGDFHAMNVAMHGDTPIFFDWSDASVGHPFIDLVSLFEDGDVLADTPDQRDYLRDVYLSHWRGAASEADLMRAYELSKPLAMLNLAISYRYIYYHQEESARAELAGAEAYWLKKLVKQMQS